MGKKHKTYHILCGKCETHVLTYHKYGAGKGILRLYLSNIAAPENLIKKISDSRANGSKAPNLICPECEEVLGVPVVSKGQRWAYRMRQGYFHRKLMK